MAKYKYIQKLDEMLTETEHFIIYCKNMVNELKMSALNATNYWQELLAKLYYYESTRIQRLDTNVHDMELFEKNYDSLKEQCDIARKEAEEKQNNFRKFKLKHENAIKRFNKLVDEYHSLI